VLEFRGWTNWLLKGRVLWRHSGPFSLRRLSGVLPSMAQPRKCDARATGT
jgi:hypothetical protein